VRLMLMVLDENHPAQESGVMAMCITGLVDNIERLQSEVLHLRQTSLKNAVEFAERAKELAK